MTNLTAQDYKDLELSLSKVGRTLDYLHGFATAIGSLTVDVDVEDYQDTIDTTEGGWTFENKEEELKIKNTMLNYFTEVKERMDQNNFSLGFPTDAENLTEEQKEQILARAAEWSMGFLEGLSLDEGLSEAIAEDEDLAELISPAMFISGVMDEDFEDFAEDDSEEGDEDESEEDDEDDGMEDLNDINVQLELVNALPVMASVLYKGLLEAKNTNSSVN
jgi:yecA family protein